MKSACNGDYDNGSESTMNLIICVDGKITRSSTSVTEGDVFSYRKLNGKIQQEKSKERKLSLDTNERKGCVSGRKRKQVCFIDEVNLDKPVPLVEVVNVVSYKKYNEAYPEKLWFKSGKDDGKARCNCGCFIY